ncbi:MAG: DNA-processing protein DprA [Streptococcaceae bacterium]|jgi:DNA processing protein|nr:DNA-processing protein DprA [Streptococcaceae bacterium]
MQLSTEMLVHLKLTKGIDNLGVWQIIKGLHDFKLNGELTAYEIAELAGLKKSHWSFITSFNEVEEKDIQFVINTHSLITIYDDFYPPLLKEMYNAPVLLFYKGNKEFLKLNNLSFVGSRKATKIGLASCRKLIQELPKHFTIVSGLAKGIDAMSHKVAVECGKKTISVIGSGLDVVYPKENQALFDYLSKEELVISEYLNGTPPLKHHFPQRNRIIAGLSMGTIVIEAKKRSGSLITCERAMEEGREVFAVPGEILTGNSNGCHQLIQQGAKCVFSAKDILSEISLAH